MKRWIILLALCLGAMLCACSSPEQTETAAPGPAGNAPTVTEPTLERAGLLDLDGQGQLPLRRLEDRFYVEAQSLCAFWDLKYSEAAGELRIGEGKGLWTFLHLSNSARAHNGSITVLNAPIYETSSGWYLPVTALEQLWNRQLVWDGEDLLRCLMVEEGPSIYFREETAVPSLRCNGQLAMAANNLAVQLGVTAEAGQTPEGVPTLSLTVRGQTLTFRAGSLTADLDGTALELPCPAWQEGSRWYLPLEATQALGCIVQTDEETGNLSLVFVGENVDCWFAGRGFSALRVGNVLCGQLGLLAEATGGEAAAKDGLPTLEALGHRLVFYPGQAEAEADGAPLALGQQVFSDGEDWLIPLAATAEALGLRVLPQEDGSLVCSRMEPCDGPLIWVDGVQVPAYTLPEGGLYLRVNDVAAAGKGSLEVTGNEATLAAWERTLRLRGGETTVLTELAPLELSAPAVADGPDWYAPATELAEALGLTELIDPELDQRYYTRVVYNEAIPTGFSVPVLMYHAVSDYTWGIPELFVSPARMEEQLQALVEGGYTAITFEDLDRVDEIEKPVILTFDDGYDDNYTELFPLLQKYNVKATIFMIVNDIGKEHKLTEDQLRELSASGLVSIQSHTLSHGYLDEMYEERLRREHYDSMLALTRITGKQPFVLCYPSGRSAGYTRDITAQYYQFGLNMGGPCYVTGDPPYRIYRYYISRYTDLETFLRDLEGK